MAELALQVVDGVLVLVLAAWLTLGVLDNIRHSAINRDDVARVLRMEALADWPEVMARVGHRRIDDPAVAVRLFGLIVIAELAASLLLWAAFVALTGVVFGLWPGEAPQALALVAVLGFTLIWTGFLIGGQWFYYWYGAFGQQSHYLAAIWGIATLAVLAS